MQGYLRNPLAEPGLIGVSSSAALGAVLAINTGVATGVALGLPIAALLGALIGVGLVLLLAGRATRIQQAQVRRRQPHPRGTGARSFPT